MSVRFLTTTGLLIAAMTALPALSFAGTEPRTEAFSLLRDLSAASADASDHAVLLQNINHPGSISWQTHGAELRAIANDVNSMGRELVQLEQMRDSVSPLERKAIDEAAGLLRKVADNTTAAIQHLNADQRDLWIPGYTKYIDSIASDSARLSDAVGKLLKLSKARDKEMQLEKSAGVEAGTL